jgi:polyisoprenoid-binding protein YceI
MKTFKLALAAIVLSATGAAALADNYAIDPVHSTDVFKIKHLNVAYVYGRINGPTGTISYDPANPEATKFDVTLEAANIDTGNAQRDNHLKSPAFFNAKEFPTLTFKSTSVKKLDDKNLEVTGDLTIHGVTKSVTVKVEVVGTGPGVPQTGPVAGFESTFTINRNDYGIKEFPGMLGDDVTFTISLEGDKK